MSDTALFVAVFLACIVEAVEALTIVLAAGTARDWRSALTGVLAGVVTLTRNGQVVVPLRPGTCSGGRTAARCAPSARATSSCCAFAGGRRL